MKVRSLRVSLGTVLALALASFAAAGLNYVDQVMIIARWGFLAALLIALLAAGRLFSGLVGASGLAAYGFLAVCVLSTAWSVTPMLSFAKSCAYAAVAIAFSAAGARWVTGRWDRDAFRPLWAMVVVAMLSGLLGANLDTSRIEMNDSVTLYRGLAHNPNFFGILLLGSLPLVLWLYFQARQGSRKNRILVPLLLLGGIGGTMMLTYSRASMLGAAVLVMFFMGALGLRKQLAAVGALTSIFAALWIAQPELIQRAEHMLLYKGEERAESVFDSRAQPWHDSYDAAVEGGFLGLGFGVSVGYTDFDVDVTSTGYGREKGNATLAIVEEVGLAGLALFAVFLALFVKTVAIAAAKAPTQERRVLLTIIMGSVLALFANAQFEAWLVAPGGAATPVFWCLVGMGLALSQHRASTSPPGRSATLATYRGRNDANAS